ncbi:MAG: MoaD/ThiS family protein [Planctomycetota bacterium]|jgi:molybdopterin synthase sulfur carrier subunit|nr:MoaD/ThiS family protein [Planctomycetota bacterium]
MATVRIPTPLRAFTGGADEVTIEGTTIDGVVAELGTAHPDLKARICDAEGKMRRFVNLYKNDEDVRALEGGNTAVSNDDVIAIVPAIAGGLQ